MQGPVTESTQETPGTPATPAIPVTSATVGQTQSDSSPSTTENWYQQTINKALSTIAAALKINSSAPTAPLAPAPALAELVAPAPVAPAAIATTPAPETLPADAPSASAEPQIPTLPITVIDPGVNSQSEKEYMETFKALYARNPFKALEYLEKNPSMSSVGLTNAFTFTD